MSSNQRPTRKKATLRSLIKARLSEMLCAHGIKSTASERTNIIYKVMKYHRQANVLLTPGSDAPTKYAREIFSMLEVTD